jgi:hypothetical protein
MTLDNRSDTYILLQSEQIAVTRPLTPIAKLVISDGVDLIMTLEDLWVYI